MDSSYVTTPIYDSCITAKVFCSTASLDSLYNTKCNDEKKAFLRRNGLELTGQVYQRLDNTFGFDEDDQYSQYSTKIQGEIGWNLFNSSFLQRKTKLQKITLQNKLGFHQHAMRQNPSLWRQQELEINRKYENLMAIVLWHQLENVKLMDLAYQYMLDRERVSNSKLLEIMNERMRLESELTQMAPPDSIYNKPIIFPISISIQIDSVALFSGLAKHNPEVQETYIREEIAEVTCKLTNYAQEMRLTPFVRVSHYLRNNKGLSSSTNVDLGVRFTFPLYDDTSRKQKALRTEKALASLEREHIEEGIKQQCTQLLNQLRQLNKAIQTEELHRQQLLEFIALHRKAYTATTKMYNYIGRLEEYNEYLKSIERMYKLLHLRSVCLLDIQKVSGYSDFGTIINATKISTK